MNEQPLDKFKLLVVGRRAHIDQAEHGFYASLKRQFQVRTLFIEDCWPRSVRDIPDYETFDAWMWWVPFRRLRSASAFDWGDYSGVKLMFDMDVVQNYYNIITNKYLGAWPEVFRRNQFDAIICTSRQVRDRLCQENIPAHWIAKAYAVENFCDLGFARASYCYYGELYPARRAMLKLVEQRGIKVTHIHCNFHDLNDYLNRYAGCLICNMAVRAKPGFLGVVQKYLPNFAVEILPGVEPMLKNFEVAGAGCAPITDWMDELEELGFVDGETMVSYRDFDELHEKLAHYELDFDGLHTIGTAAARLVQQRHTWDHRAIQMHGLLGQLIRS